jgi:hypothetical protein
MATSYVFTRRPDQDECRVSHLGKHLVTTTKWNDEVVQEFASDAAAQAHIDRFVVLRKRTGYAVREIEQTPDAIILPRELSSDPLTKFVFWVNRPSRRLAILLDGTVSRQTLAAIVDRIQEEKPSTIAADVSSKSPPNKHFGQAFVGKSLPTVRNLIFTNEMLVDDPAFQYGDLDNVFTAMPELQRAFFNGDLVFRPFQHSALVELYLVGDPLRIATVDALGACSLPALQKLRIMLTEEARCECRSKRVAIALSALDAPCLEWLHVQSIQDIAHFLEGFLNRGLPSPLHTLRLEGEIPDEDALLEVLERHADELRNLRHISLPLLDEVSLCAVDRVKELLPNHVDQSTVSSDYIFTTSEEW